MGTITKKKPTTQHLKEEIRNMSCRGLGHQFLLGGRDQKGWEPLVKRTESIEFKRDTERANKRGVKLKSQICCNTPRESHGLVFTDKWWLRGSCKSCVYTKSEAWREFCKKLIWFTFNMFSASFNVTDLTKLWQEKPLTPVLSFGSFVFFLISSSFSCSMFFVNSTKLS